MSGRVHRFCEYCHHEILLKGKKKNSRFCSQRCMGNAMRRIPTHRCLQCHKPMRSTWKHPVSQTRRFCSQSCYFAYRGETRIEQAIRKELDQHDVLYLAQHQIGRYVVDFAIHTKGYIVEADGEYWHGPMAKPRSKQFARWKFLALLGFKTIRIPEASVKDGTFIDLLKPVWS